MHQTFQTNRHFDNWVFTLYGTQVNEEHCFDSREDLARFVYAKSSHNFDGFHEIARHHRGTVLPNRSVYFYWQESKTWTNSFGQPCQSTQLCTLTIQALSPHNRALDIALLIAEGRKLYRSPFLSERPRPYYLHSFWNGTGPVPGTAKSRGGRHYFRHPQTMQERRAVFALDDPEEAYRTPPPRAARNLHHLPHSWDDMQSSVEHNWKSQGKKRASWDRKR